MHWILILSGLLLCNAVPHLTAGLRGEPFPTPFAKPPGKGLSSALVNFCWGSTNLVVALYLLSLQPVVLGLNSDCALLLLGALIGGAFLSIHFGKVMAGRL